MRIHIDESQCAGHGRCYSLEPSLFEADDGGYPLQRGYGGEVPEGSESAARRAIANCPERAISMVGE